MSFMMAPLYRDFGVDAIVIGIGRKSLTPIPMTSLLKLEINAMGKND